MIVTGLSQNPAQRLPHVRATIRYHDRVVCLSLSPSEHALPLCS
jgi:hypothetical protein